MILILKQCHFINYSALLKKYTRVQILLSVHMTRFAYTQTLHIRKMGFALGLRQVQIFQLLHACKFCIRELMRTHGQICVRMQILHICKICTRMQANLVMCTGVSPKMCHRKFLVPIGQPFEVYCNDSFVGIN